MALIVRMDKEDLNVMGSWVRSQIYNGGDATVTREVFDVIHPRLTETTDLTYRFEMATQAPAMAMMRRGIAVDAGALRHALGELDTDASACDVKVNAAIPPGAWDRKEIVAGKCADGKNHKWPRGEPDETRCCEKCGTSRMRPAGLNPNSDDQVKELLYGKLRLPVQHHRKTKEPSVDEECLERLERKFPKHKPLLRAVLEARGIQKQIGVLNSRLSPDGRMRSSFNVGAPETGRWSSSKNHYGDGTNLQNIAEKNRFIFVADPGMELVYADLEQAESRCVAYLAADEKYIEAHVVGDVHTYVSRLIWPELPWTGDLRRDKEIAERPAPFDPDHSYRYNCKRIQHGSNYGLTPHGIAQLAHIPIAAADAAQGAYFDNFPGIPAWQKFVVAELERTHTITTPLARRRQFFGRHWDKHVQRQAIAFIPQSMVADILNVALWRAWEELDTFLGPRPCVSDPNRLWLLAQVHDAILAERREGDEEVVARLLELMQVPVLIGGRTMVIPADVKIGKSWRMR